jgi:hypothetical protein
LKEIGLFPMESERLLNLTYISVWNNNNIMSDGISGLNLWTVEILLISVFKAEICGPLSFTVTPIAMLISCPKKEYFEWR